MNKKYFESLQQRLKSLHLFQLLDCKKLINKEYEIERKYLDKRRELEKQEHLLKYEYQTELLSIKRQRSILLANKSYALLKRHVRWSNNNRKPSKHNKFSILSKFEKQGKICKGEKVLKCNICEYATLYKHCFKIHMRKHIGENPYSTEAKTDTQNNAEIVIVDLGNDMSVDAQKDANIFKVKDKNLRKRVCVKPDKRQTDMNDKVSQIVAKTENERKKFHCDHCEYIGRNLGRLHQHMQTHTREKPFKCSVCAYASARKHDLKTHMRKHTGEKPYKCTHCPFASSYISTLLSHSRKHHSTD